MPITPRLAATLAASALAVSAAAQTAAPASGRPGTPSPPAAAASAPWIDAVVRGVDPAKGRISLQHGAITNLDMPGMTMAFPVADARVLDTLKAGDKVVFTAERVKGAATVTRVKRVP